MTKTTVAEGAERTSTSHLRPIGAPALHRQALQHVVDEPLYTAHGWARGSGGYLVCKRPAGRVFGARHQHVIFQHLVPNVLGVVAVNATLKMADAIYIYAAMAVLGLSLLVPATSWGNLPTAGIDHVFDGYWWQLWPPAIAIVLIALAVNVVGDGLHDLVARGLDRG
jgi:hypothetical protein